MSAEGRKTKIYSHGNISTANFFYLYFFNHLMAADYFPSQLYTKFIMSI